MHALSVIRTRDSRIQAALDGTFTGIGKTTLVTLYGRCDVLTHCSDEDCRAFNSSQHCIKKDWNLQNLKAECNEANKLIRI